MFQLSISTAKTNKMPTNHHTQQKAPIKPQVVLAEVQRVEHILPIAIAMAWGGNAIHKFIFASGNVVHSTPLVHGHNLEGVGKVGEPVARFEEPTVHGGL